MVASGSTQIAQASRDLVPGSDLRPQGAFTTFETSDPDELAKELGRAFNLASVDVCGRNARLSFHLRAFDLGDAAVFHGRYNSEIEIAFPEFPAFVGSAGPIHGAGEHRICGTEVTVSKGNGVVVSPGRVKLHYGAGFEHVSVLVQPDALKKKLSTLLGDLRLGPFRIDPLVDGHTPESQRLQRLLRFVQGEMELDCSMPPILQAELEQTLIVTLLLATRHTYSDALRTGVSSVASWRVRRAEQYIEAHWDQPITIEALVAVTEVCARSLYASFRTERGYTPMEFVKRVRLGKAHELLKAPQPETSVTAVAIDCGFGNLGHFSRDYREQFGEPPSRTLMRGRLR